MSNINPHLSSHLFRLPAEIRSEIYFLTLTSTAPIIDPTFGPSVRSRYKSIPPFGTGLLRGCRVVNAELDIQPLYTTNDFAFTSPGIYADFLDALPEKHKRLFKAVRLDIRGNVRCNETDDGEHDGAITVVPQQVLAWSHYLICSPDRQLNGPRFCLQHGQVHLTAHVPPLTKIVLDMCELKRTAARNYEAPGVMPPTRDTVARAYVSAHQDGGLRIAQWKWWEDVLHGIPAEVEVWLRRLDRENQVREVEVPVGVCSRDPQREYERREVLREWWFREFDREGESRW